MKIEKLKNGIENVTLSYEDVEFLVRDIREALRNGDSYLLERILAWKNHLSGVGNAEIERDVIVWIKENIESGKTILEFGSGKGTTKLLGDMYNLISIEEDVGWVGRYKSNYIHAPIKDNWYDIEIVKDAISDLDYDVIIIDGPARGSRCAMGAHLDLFDLDKVIICDDIERDIDEYLWNLMIKETEKYNRRSVILGHNSKTGIIY
jgi:hypothetical protein